MEATCAKFTWYTGGLSQRLHMAICNLDWESFAPKCIVRILHRLKSDYRPILISLQSPKDQGDHPFCCLANWFSHAYFGNIVRSNWKNDLPALENLNHFQEVG